MNVADQFYYDTSALLPYYREETLSKMVQDILISLQPPVIICDLTKIEFASALARWIRMDEISEAQANLVENTFAKDIGSGLFLCKTLNTSHYRQAEKWLYSRKTAIRTLDALHLACCWHVDAEMITCDNVLYQSARILGVRARFLSPL